MTWVRYMSTPVCAIPILFLCGRHGHRFTRYRSSANSGGRDVLLHSLTADKVAVPEPASIAIIGAGLLGIGMIRRRRARG